MIIILFFIMTCFVWLLKTLWTVRFFVWKMIKNYTVFCFKWIIESIKLVHLIKFLLSYSIQSNWLLSLKFENSKTFFFFLHFSIIRIKSFNKKLNLNTIVFVFQGIFITTFFSHGAIPQFWIIYKRKSNDDSKWLTRTSFFIIWTWELIDRTIQSPFIKPFTCSANFKWFNVTNFLIIISMKVFTVRIIFYNDQNEVIW